MSAVLIVIHPVIVSVEAVLKAMHRVEEGDFTTRVEKRGNMPAEVVEIADGFNEMVAQTDLLLGQVRQSALEQKNAEISALEAQIDPHFLYNTLDTINWKAIAREEYEISEMAVSYTHLDVYKRQQSYLLRIPVPEIRRRAC